MARTPEGLFLKFAAGRRNQLASRIEDCLGRLSTRRLRARGGVSGPELAARLGSVVAEAVAVIGSTTAGRLVEPVRNVSVPEATGHVTEHFAQQTGQNIFATKLLTGEDLGYYRHLKAAAHGEKTP